MKNYNLTIAALIGTAVAYPIQNLQLDADAGEGVVLRSAVTSDPICSSAGCTQYSHPVPPATPKRDYFVPNFGQDSDIKDSHQSIKDAEGTLGHKWVMATKATKAKWHNKAKDTLYNYAPKLDGEMRTSLKNLDDSETTVGH